MSHTPDNTVIVKILDSETCILESNRDSNTDLESLGFKPTEKIRTWKKLINTKEEEFDLINKLIDLDALFSFGWGWYPSEVLKYYKEQGLLKRSFKEIMWSGPGKYQIQEM